MTDLLENPIPANVETERMVLGAIILYNDLAPEALENLTSEDFHHIGHRVVFDAIGRLFAAGGMFDVLLIGNDLTATGHLNYIGGVVGIADLTRGVPFLSNISKYIAILTEKRLARALIKVGNKLVADASDTENRAASVLENAEQSLFNLSHGQEIGKLEHAGIGADECIAWAEAMHGQEYSGIPSGLVDLDRKTKGWQPGELIFIAARPSMGKSALGIGLAVHAAKTVPVAFFSLEMPRRDVSKRILGLLGRVDIHRITNGDLNQLEWAAIAEAREELNNRKIFIDDSTSLSTMALRAKLRRITATQKSLGLVVIDYLGFMRGSGKYDSRNHELGAISRDLKELAKDMAVPVVCLCQLNRATEGRADRKPMLSDLRDSGELEQNADVVILLYRENYYQTQKQSVPDYDAKRGLAELIIAKHRNGPTGMVEVTFKHEYASFENLMKEEWA